MQLFIRTADYPSNPNITEAAFDHLSITNEAVIGMEEWSKPNSFKLYPNPGQDQLTIGSIEAEIQVQLFHLDGKSCLTTSVSPTHTTIDVHTLPNGVYIVEIAGQRFSWVKLGQ
jgi:hypothetical protein